MVLCVNNKEFILKLLKEGNRFDGRSFTDIRDIEIQFNRNYGHVEVSIGKTRALCVVQGEIVAPFSDRPNEGFFFFNVDLRGIASCNFLNSASSISSFMHAGVPTAGAGESLNYVTENNIILYKNLKEESIEICNLIEKLLKKSRAIDYESLCILSGLKVWSIRVDIRILNDDGNLRDACVLSAVAGITHYRKREVLIENETKIYTDVEKQPILLSIHHMPVLVSLGCIENFEDTFIVDSTEEEESILNGIISIGVNQYKEICGIHKPGGTPLSLERIEFAIELATKKAVEIIDKLNLALKKDAEMRKFKRYSAIPLNVQGSTKRLCLNKSVNVSDIFFLMDDEKIAKEKENKKDIEVVLKETREKIISKKKKINEKAKLEEENEKEKELNRTSENDEKEPRAYPSFNLSTTVDQRVDLKSSSVSESKFFNSDLSLAELSKTQLEKVESDTINDTDNLVKDKVATETNEEVGKAPSYLEQTVSKFVDEENIFDFTSALKQKRTKKKKKN